MIVANTWDELPFRKMCSVTHFLIVTRQDVMRMPFNVQHSLTVGHWPRCDETTFQKNVQYSHPLSVGQVGDSH